MGLDNGICVKIKTKDFKEKFKKEYDYALSKGCIFPFDINTFDNYDFELAYWRKCWNVRNSILDKLGSSKNVLDYKVSLDEFDLESIIEILNDYVNQEQDDDWEPIDCIWEWSVFKRICEQNILNIKFLLALKRVHPEIECYFYDSY